MPPPSNVTEDSDVCAPCPRQGRIQPLWISRVITTPMERHRTPRHQLCYTPLTTTLFGCLTGEKGGENYTCLHVGERQLSYLQLQAKGKEWV